MPNATDIQNAILVSVRTVYGRKLVYPECPKAHVFAKLNKTDTLPEAVLVLIKELGFKILVKQGESEL